MNKIIIQSLILTTIISLPLHTQENLVTESTENNWEQRRQAVKDYIRQELEKGTPIEEIHNKLIHQSENTPENQAYKDAFKARLEAYYNKIPTCKLTEENYKKAKNECDTLQKIHRNTPEEQANLNFEIFLYNKEIIEENIEKAVQQKQKKEEKIQQLSLELSKRKEKLLNSLLQ